MRLPWTASGPNRIPSGSSDTAERGFCVVCGGNLFWKQVGRDAISITAGTLDTPTHLTVEEHIFVADKSDYYSIDDDLPKQQLWSSP